MKVFFIQTGVQLSWMGLSWCGWSWPRCDGSARFLALSMVSSLLQRYLRMAGCLMSYNVYLWWVMWFCCSVVVVLHVFCSGFLQYSSLSRWTDSFQTWIVCLHVCWVLLISLLVLHLFSDGTEPTYTFAKALFKGLHREVLLPFLPV